MVHLLHRLYGVDAPVNTRNFHFLLPVRPPTSWFPWRLVPHSDALSLLCHVALPTHACVVFDLRLTILFTHLPCGIGRNTLFTGRVMALITAGRLSVSIAAAPSYAIFIDLPRPSHHPPSL